LVAASLPRASRILCSPLEHHANLLPWRDHHVEHLPFVSSAASLCEQTDAALQAAARAGRPFDVLAVCAASNVTGEVMPISELAASARKTGTRILVDAAQFAPHRALSTRELGVDFLALSGHKLYAPFGSGALITRRDLLQDAPPLLKGGGAVRVVTLEDVAWADLPHRLEAGTPNVLGAVALAAACEELTTFGMSELEEREQALARRLWDGLAEFPACTVLRGWQDSDPRIAVASFTLAGHDARDVAESLARDHGVAVRSGLFCAHPFVSHLLGRSGEGDALVERARAGDEVTLTGAVRASIGIGVQPEHIEQLLEGLAEILRTPAQRTLSVSSRA
jgi:selenocysteine lyase/cysteine desulfurase